MRMSSGEAVDDAAKKLRREIDQHGSLRVAASAAMDRHRRLVDKLSSSLKSANQALSEEAQARKRIEDVLKKAHDNMDPIMRKVKTEYDELKRVLADGDVTIFRALEAPSWLPDFDAKVDERLSQMAHTADKVVENCRKRVEAMRRGDTAKGSHGHGGHGGGHGHGGHAHGGHGHDGGPGSHEQGEKNNKHFKDAVTTVRAQLARSEKGNALLRSYHEKSERKHTEIKASLDALPQLSVPEGDAWLSQLRDKCARYHEDRASAEHACTDWRDDVNKQINGREMSRLVEALQKRRKLVDELDAKQKDVERMLKVEAEAVEEEKRRRKAANEMTANV